MSPIAMQVWMGASASSPSPGTGRMELRLILVRVTIFTAMECFRPAPAATHLNAHSKQCELSLGLQLAVDCCLEDPELAITGKSSGLPV